MIKSLQNTVYLSSIADIMKIEIRYSWRCKWGRRTITSPIKMTEEQARQSDPDAVRLDSTREECVVFDQPVELLHYGATASFAGARPPPRAVFTYPCNVPGYGNTIPLKGLSDLYVVSQVGDAWTMVQTGNPPLLLYRGPGPVRVEPAP